MMPGEGAPSTLLQSPYLQAAGYTLILKLHLTILTAGQGLASL